MDPRSMKSLRPLLLLLALSASLDLSQTNNVAAPFLAGQFLVLGTARLGWMLEVMAVASQR
jgi:hypothetical protein